MSAIPKDGEIPTLVALHRGKAHEILNERLQRLLDVMHLDPDLNLSAATGALLGTAADLKARLDVYLLYPGKFVLMCRRWFPVTYKSAIGNFFVSTDRRVRCRVLFAVAAPRLGPRGRNSTTSFPG